MKATINFFLILISISCNSNEKYADKINVEIIKVLNSPYEEDVKIVEIKLTNNTSDTVFVERKDKVSGTIAGKIDFADDEAIIYFSNTSLKKTSQEFKGTILAVPDILISDSAYKLYEYYNNLSKFNNRFSQENGFYKLMPKESICFNLILHFSIYELYQIDPNSLNDKTAIQLVLNLKTFKKNNGVSSMSNVHLYSNKSQELKKIFQ